MEIDNLVPIEVKDKVGGIPTSMGKEMLNGLVNGFLGENSIVHKVKTVDITWNAYDIYANLHLNIPGLLK